ncbi:inorganic phosphate transporter [Vogesella indigofera]|uniref:inorganic phosphate transporter n=1 Tax=Vogesella indigofera TaxID=45465 RepID=UPI00234E5001|nr:inorganic phosphate transporter [Vogesella indigofera]MDC7702149.1 inorganic phosphate transporter [Vogesella indigofera]
MLELLSGLDTLLAITLVLSITFVLAFEFINGFHDTANAVATVIYTQSMKPETAVLLSGFFNFLGVFFGGLAVAYAIVNLIPTDLLLNINSAQGMVMVFALLTSAIVWNLGTWYFGIPASSSHTLIGAILGVGIGNALLTGDSIVNGINWSKAIDVFLSLFLSPLFGAGLAGLMLFTLMKLRPLSNIHKSPFQRQQIEGRKHPPFWARFMLIVSSMGMSFTHGSNDGQKGVGLVMLVLIALAPAHFVVNLEAEPIQIEHTKIAAIQLKELYQRNQVIIDLKYPVKGNHQCEPSKIVEEAGALLSAIGDAKSFQTLPEAQRWNVRTQLICLADGAKKISKVPGINDVDQKQLKGIQKDLTQTTEYAPTWVIVAVALAIGLGTMVGWKRVVNTVGEKIGKKDMTYAQGMAAQTMSALSIGLASLIGAPVSTTQILSSAVAGTMVVNRSGVQLSTIKTILTTWVLTLPVSMGLAISLYYVGVKLFV